MGLVTENNVPNAKVIASTVIGLAIPLYLSVAPMLGLPTFEPEFMKENTDKVIAGVVAVMTVVAYFTKPRPGDGVKENK